MGVPLQERMKCIYITVIIMYCITLVMNLRKLKYIGPNNRHFTPEVSCTCCWVKTHNTVNLWENMTTWQHWRSVRSHFEQKKWHLFELLDFDGLQLKHRRMQHVHNSKQTLPMCKQWVNHTTHAGCSQYKYMPHHNSTGSESIYHEVDLSTT